MEDYTSGAGYLSTELFCMMLPLIFISIGASWGANAIVQEEERRTTDILLTLPISRVRVLSVKITAAVIAQVLLAADWGKRSIALGGAIALAIAGFFSLAPLVDTFE